MSRENKLPRWAAQGRVGWKHTGQERPSFAVPPGPGQESVWDYPRPPRLERDSREVIILWQNEVVARTEAAFRGLETAHPPTFYLPPESINRALVQPSPTRQTSRCEWKGEAIYYDVVANGEKLSRIAWTYPDPFDDFAELRDYFAFYPTPIKCTLDGIRVEPQPGRFYAGWVTPELAGPFKGEPGSEGW